LEVSSVDEMIEAVTALEIYPTLKAESWSPMRLKQALWKWCLDKRSSAVRLSPSKSNEGYYPELIVINCVDNFYWWCTPQSFVIDKLLPMLLYLDGT
jgi:hypothetical protein